MNQPQFRKLINLIESADRRHLKESFDLNFMLDQVCDDLGLLVNVYNEKERIVQDFADTKSVYADFKSYRLPAAGPSARWVNSTFESTKNTLRNIIKYHPEHTSDIRSVLNYMVEEGKVKFKDIEESLLPTIYEYAEKVGYQPLIAVIAQVYNSADRFESKVSELWSKDAELSRGIEKGKKINGTQVGNITDKEAHRQAQANDLNPYSYDASLAPDTDEPEFASGKEKEEKTLTPFPDRPGLAPEPRKSMGDYTQRDISKPEFSLPANFDPYKDRPKFDKNGKPIPRTLTMRTAGSDEEGRPIARRPYAQQADLTPTVVVPPNSPGSSRSTKFKDFDDRPTTIEPLSPDEAAYVKHKENRGIKTRRQTRKGQLSAADQLIDDILDELSEKLPPGIVSAIVSKVVQSPNKLLSLQAELKQRGLEWALDPNGKPPEQAPSGPEFGPRTVVLPKSTMPTQPKPTLSRPPLSTPSSGPARSSAIPATKVIAPLPRATATKSNAPTQPATVVVKRKSPLITKPSGNK